MLYRIRQNKCDGYIDEMGTVIVKPVYDWVGAIYFGVCVVAKENKCGLISVEGVEMIAPQYDFLGAVGENRIYIKDKQQIALADFNGKLITEFKYNRICNFSEGLAAACKGLKWGYLDENGKEKIPFDFDSADAFDQGYAMVQQGTKMGLLNRSGLFEKKPVYDSYHAWENCYSVNIGGSVSDDHATGGKFGLLSKNNIELTKLEFDFIGIFLNGETSVMKDELYGVINDKGQIIVPLNSKEHIWPRYKFQKIINDHKVGLIDENGNELIPAVYEDLTFYPESLLCWAKQNGLYGILNLENEFIIAPSFELNTIYPIGKEEVHIELPSGKHGLLSIPSGKWILVPEYDGLVIFEGSLVGLWKEGRMMYANLDGKIVWTE